ncbi:MAG: hypothetical protein IID45_08960 [Planctomycetes bacterium]|nr:hypothetical protein [Planctomycetota bacterium]
MFEERFLVPVCTGVAPREYAVLAAEFGFRTVMKATNAVETVRRKFTRALQTVIAGFVPEEEQNSELASVREILVAAAEELSEPLQQYLAEQSTSNAEPIEQIGPSGLNTVLDRLEREEVPNYSSFEDELADVLDTPVDFGRTAADAGPTILDLLLNPSPSLELLEETKRTFKRMGKSSSGIVSPQTARYVYLCCSFAALPRLSQRITSLSDQELLAGLNWIRSLHVPGKLEELLRDAEAALSLSLSPQKHPPSSS